jgi:hypothetical protein
MAVNAASLVVRYPEFTSTPTTLVDASIADAELMIDRAYYRGKADMAVTAYAAHLIAINPLGEMARLDKKGEKTTYWLHYENIKRSLGAGCRVI